LQYRTKLQVPFLQRLAGLNLGLPDMKPSTRRKGNMLGRYIPRTKRLRHLSMESYNLKTPPVPLSHPTYCLQQANRHSHGRSYLQMMCSKRLMALFLTAKTEHLGVQRTGRLSIRSRYEYV
jgi:hypothetical protein